jgi:hypothetical protein
LSNERVSPRVAGAPSLVGTAGELQTAKTLPVTLHNYLDVVCPYSYIVGFEDEEAEDDGFVGIQWLPFELGPAPEPLPDPRGDFIRHRWRGQVYLLTLAHDVEIHFLRYQPRSTLALELHSFAVEEEKGWLTGTPRTTGKDASQV